MSSHVIERHPIDLDWARSQLARKPQHHERLVTSLRTKPSILKGLASSLEQQFAYIAAVEPQSPALLEAARAAARALTALIGFAGGDRETRTLDLGFTTVEAAPFEADADAQQWLRAFSYALIARDEEASERLAKTEIQTLRQGAKQRGVEMDGYHYIWVATLQTWRLGEDIVNHLIDLKRNTVPEEIHIAAPEMVRITQELAQALAALLSDEAGVFNDSLAAAVEQHKAWWSKDKETGPFDGFVALEPLALACAAHDAGMKVTVESDYLPAKLITAK